MYITPEYQTLVILTVLLVLIFLFLLAYTFYTRAKKMYWHRYKEKFQDYFLPVLFTFVEEVREPSDADEVIKKLSKRTKDIAFFLELINEMGKILRGEEREQLDLLINHELFSSFYRKKLLSFSKQKQLIASIYFEKSGSINTQVCTRLVKLSKSKNTKLAYGASKALQSSEILNIRKKALIRFMKRDDATDLMVGELLHLFYREEMHIKIGEALKDILFQKDIPPAKKKIVVLFIAHQNFYEYSDSLLQYLRKLRGGPEKAHLVAGLIKALGQLRVKEATPVIKKYASSQNLKIRLACVEALSLLGGTENLTFLIRLLLDIEFSVRKKVIEILVQHPDVGHQLLDQFLVYHQKYISWFRKHTNPPEELRVIVQKIYSIALGIKIMLSKQMEKEPV